MVTSYISPEVENTAGSLRACAIHPAIIIGTVRSLWTWLWGRYHVPQDAFLVVYQFVFFYCVHRLIDCVCVYYAYMQLVE